MIFKCTLLVVLGFACANGQTADTESGCTAQPHCSCNCGAFGPPSDKIGGDNQSNIRQGRPGKIGPRGDTGRKGQKGERGRTDDTSEELMDLKTQVEEQKIQIDQLRTVIFETPETCEDIAVTSNRTSGFYLISPGRKYFPFRVYCNFADNVTETIIHHNTSSELQAANCDMYQCSKHKISYEVTLSKIIALIEHSSECRQFIKYRCLNSVLLAAVSGTTYGAWLSRDGTPQTYWGGATSRRAHYCACGETNSCVDRSKTCNCDKNSAPETSDEGYLTDKDKLPVSEVRFGDIGDSGENGWFTLGSLICSGRSR